MKQIDDCFTLELIEAAAKRGRGRPRKDKPLSPAERSRFYRMRQRVMQRNERLALS